VPGGEPLHFPRGLQQGQGAGAGVVVGPGESGVFSTRGTPVQTMGGASPDALGSLHVDGVGTSREGGQGRGCFLGQGPWAVGRVQVVLQGLAL